MMERSILLARQPIYDASLGVFAYELLHRSIDPEQSRVQDGDEASSRVLVDAFGSPGLAGLTDGKPAFINFTEHLILNPPPLDPALLVVEVLEDVRPTTAVIEGLRSLRAQGFRIALDDFRHDEALAPMIELADIVKLDVLACDAAGLREQVRKLRNYPARLLAEKIESWEVYNHCVDLGFSYFQGFFLARPQPVHGLRLAPSRRALLDLMVKIGAPEAGIESLAATVATDPLLGFNLIRLVNSPLYRRTTPVETLREAISRLGLERLRGWCHLLLLTRIDGKPRELTRIAMQRARFAELLCGPSGTGDSARGFTLGIISSLDAFLDQPMAELLPQLNLGNDMGEALLARNGKLGAILQTVLAFEAADWDGVPWEAICALGLDQQSVEAAYLDSIAWTRETLGTIESR
jgi:EAL and modified HD-GYP domain-containing signal transduction protein